MSEPKTVGEAMVRLRLARDHGILSEKELGSLRMAETLRGLIVAKERSVGEEEWQAGTRVDGWTLERYREAQDQLFIEKETA